MADRSDDVTLTFGGTATMLLRIGAFTLLTDTNFLHRGQYARLGYGLRSKRLTEPALQPTLLPALDGILLSHMHGDHWDRIATKALPKETPVITTPEAATCLEERGFTATADLTAWQTHEFSRGPDTLRITSVPGVHGPAPLARLLPQVMGNVIELIRDGEVSWRGYISGDTVYRPFLGEVLKPCGPLDVLSHIWRHQGPRRHHHDGRPAGRRPRRAAEAAGHRARALRRLPPLRVTARGFRRRGRPAPAARRTAGRAARRDHLFFFFFFFFFSCAPSGVPRAQTCNL